MKEKFTTEEQQEHQDFIHELQRKRQWQERQVQRKEDKIEQLQ